MFSYAQQQVDQDRQVRLQELNKYNENQGARSHHPDPGGNEV
jgi:hypothetical protein